MIMIITCNGNSDSYDSGCISDNDINNDNDNNIDRHNTNLHL